MKWKMTKSDCKAFWQVDCFQESKINTEKSSEEISIDRVEILVGMVSFCCYGVSVGDECLNMNFV